MKNEVQILPACISEIIQNAEYQVCKLWQFSENTVGVDGRMRCSKCNAKIYAGVFEKNKNYCVQCAIAREILYLDFNFSE